MVGAEMPSSPQRGSNGFASLQAELDYYKTAYETLDAELQEFQSSSKELEAELERDVEESEKRERKLQEKVERLGFEAEEWKVRWLSEPFRAIWDRGANEQTDQVQAEQDRGQQRAEHAAEGNHHSARCPAYAAAQAARHGSPERRL